MLKSLGLGICCLTLSISGVTRASVLPTCDGKYGDDKCIKTEDRCDDKKVDFKSDCDLKPILCDINKDKDKDCKDDHKDCKIPTDKDGKDVCKVDLKCHETLLCDIDNKHDKDHCDVTIDHRCDYNPCDHDNHHDCEPHAVPAPASAAFGGLGIAGIMAMVGLRSRRSVKA